MTRYFTADPHLYHEKVGKIRFPNSETPTFDGVDVFVRNLNRLHKGDQLWILGDLTCGKIYQEDMAIYMIRNFKESRGKNAPQIHLIWGNHDSGSPIHRDGWKRHRKFLEAFDSVQQSARLRFGSENVLLSHFPYDNLGDGPDREGSRYPEFRIPNNGTPLIHGHTHQTTPHAKPRNYRRGDFGASGGVDTSQYCVSWDVARKFVPESDIFDWLERRENDIRDSLDLSFDKTELTFGKES